MLRRTLSTLAATAVLATAASSAVAAPVTPDSRASSALSARQASGVPSSIPASCATDMTTMLPRSTRVGWVVLHDKEAYVNDVGPGTSLGFTPKAMVVVSDELLSETRGRVRAYAVKSTGTLYYVVMSFTYASDGRVSVKTTKRAIANGWDDTRALAGTFHTKRRVLYRLHGSALRRYDLALDGRVTNSTSVARTGWYSTRTISIYDTNSWTDVLASTTSSGELVSNRISKKVPATGSASHVLAKTGFGNFKALSTGHCASTGMVFYGVRTTGGLAAFYDRNRTDNVANLVGGYVKGTNWPYRVYSN